MRKYILLALLVVLGTACTPEEVDFYMKTTAGYEQHLSDDQLTALRTCESGGRYDINTGNGFYGAYQFTRGTWNGVANRHFPWLAGQSPETTDPFWQDAMARALYSERGAQPWPVCGRRL